MFRIDYIEIRCQIDPCARNPVSHARFPSPHSQPPFPQTGCLWITILRFPVAPEWFRTHFTIKLMVSTTFYSKNLEMFLKKHCDHLGMGAGNGGAGNPSLRENRFQNGSGGSRVGISLTVDEYGYMRLARAHSTNISVSYDGHTDAISIEECSKTAQNSKKRWFCDFFKVQQCRMTTRADLVFVELSFLVVIG